MSRVSDRIAAVAGLLAAGFITVGITTAVASHDPQCERTEYPDKGVSVEVCLLEPAPSTTTTTAAETTTTSGATTTTTSPATTTSAPTTTTTSAPPTTVAPTTTTTQPPAPTTTAPPSSSTINLTGDWMIHGHDARQNFTVNGNGHSIMVMGGTVDWSNFQIDNVARVMFMDGAGPSHLEDGLITNSGRSGQLGFYPLHWHLNYNTTRGTVVDNVTIRNGRNHAFVPHGSHGITILNSTAVNTSGEALWWDDPGTTNCNSSFPRFCTADNTNDLTVDNLTVSGVSVPSGSSGNRNAGVQLGAGSGNTIRNSSVTGVAGQVDCSAYKWPESANMNDGGTVWTFQNNTGSSSCHGIFVWQNDGTRHHIVDGFSGGGIDHGAYSNAYDYRNVTVPYVEVHAKGWRMSDSHVTGDVILRKHQSSGNVVWTNVDIDGQIRVADAPSGSQIQPITFTVTGTNATCADVVWSNPHPQTRVILNGVQC